MASLQNIQTLLSLICLLFSSTIVLPMDRNRPGKTDRQTTSGASSSSSSAGSSSSSSAGSSSSSSSSSGRAPMEVDLDAYRATYSAMQRESHPTQAEDQGGIAAVPSDPYYQELSSSSAQPLTPSVSFRNDLAKAALIEASLEMFRKMLYAIPENLRQDFITQNTNILRTAISRSATGEIPFRERATARIEILLDFGFDPNMSTGSSSPYILTDSSSPLIQVIGFTLDYPYRYGEILNIIDLLVSRGARLNEYNPETGHSPLQYAEALLQNLHQFNDKLFKGYIPEALCIIISRLRQLQEFQELQPQLRLQRISAITTATPLISELADLVGSYAVQLPDRLADQHADPQSALGREVRNRQLRATLNRQVALLERDTRTASASTASSPSLMAQARAAITNWTSGVVTAALAYIMGRDISQTRR